MNDVTLADGLEVVTPPSPAPSVGYTWDDNGDLTQRGSDSFSWDHEDRLVSATVNAVTSSSAYRGDGLRDSRTVGATTTTFTWDIAGGLPVVLDDGNQYVYGAGLTAMKQSGSWHYYLADGLGSTMAVVDSSGNSQKSYQYDVYGEVTGGSGSLSNEFDFAGQQTDPTGLQYLRARYYDPATGSFLSRDPLASVPAWLENGYSYAACSPSTFDDPTGLVATKKGCKEQWDKKLKPAMDKLKQKIAERAAAAVKDEGHAKQIEQLAEHLRDQMKKFDNWQNPCKEKKFKPDNFDEKLWDEAEKLVKEYAPKESSVWDKVKDKVTDVPDLPEVPDVWWDGDPFNPWSLPIPGPKPVLR